MEIEKRLEKTETDFKTIIDLVLDYQIPQMTIFYEPQSGFSYNIIKVANELTEKGFKVAILIKNRYFLTETRKKVNKKVKINYKEEYIRGLELDFIFVDETIVDLEALQALYCKHIIQVLRNKKGSIYKKY